VATKTPSTTSHADAASKRSDGASTPLADATGTISNRPGGEGTRQVEPRPEDMPADAKITSVASQLNPATEQAVGEPPAAAVASDDDTKEALEAGQQQLTDTQNDARKPADSAK